MKIFKRKPIKTVLIPVVAIILVTAGMFWLFSKNPAEVKAGWWNDNWTYRQSIQVTNNTTTETNVYIDITLDTNTASTSMQADCGDFRFITEDGENLDYYIVSGCRSSSANIHVNFSTFPSGEQTIYFYYGNPSAENGFSASDFTTEASNYAIGAVGDEETGPGPVGYWSFDEGYGTTAHDSSSQGNNGTITGATWQDESMCLSGKCLYFDGSDDEVSISNTIKEAKTLIFWIKSTSTTASFIDLDGSTYVSASAGIVSATGFTSPTIYVNGLENNKITANTWQMVAITTNTAIEASAMKIGSANSTYLAGYIDEVKIYPYARSAEQIKMDYASGLAATSPYEGEESGTVSAAWVNVSQGEADLACQAMGTGYHLMTENEWLTIADNIIRVAANDIDPEKPGIQLAIASTTNGHESGDGSTLIANASSTGYVLTNGNIIYNLAGGIGEWTDMTVTKAGLPNLTPGPSPSQERGDGWYEYHEVLDYKGLNIAPPYYYSSENGIGRIRTSAEDEVSLRGFVRGYDGIFSLDLSYSPAAATSTVGFRCAR